MVPDPIAAETTIKPADIIARHSVEELIETADEYYRGIADPTALMSRPFAYLHEAPVMLQNLGALLAGLQLGKTMTVLEFGAGTCWLSRCLAQLNCQPICCDASKAALDIGRRLFAEHPLIGPTVFAPVFLPFDGHRIELDDESVDRIVCFDALHHVPNVDEVMGELGRVLREGGIAGFSEPGRDHSRSAQAQYEMRDHRVLENDIDLRAIFAAARDAGFTQLTARVANDLEVSVDHYQAIVERRGPGCSACDLEQHVRHDAQPRGVLSPQGRDAARQPQPRRTGARDEHDTCGSSGGARRAAEHRSAHRQHGNRPRG